MRSLLAYAWSRILTWWDGLVFETSEDFRDADSRSSNSSPVEGDTQRGRDQAEGAK